MNAVGVDGSKGKSMVAVRRSLNDIVAKPFEVRHIDSELKQLADYLKSLGGETRVIMEHTGRHYGPVPPRCGTLCQRGKPEADQGQRQREHLAPSQNG